MVKLLRLAQLSGLFIFFMCVAGYAQTVQIVAEDDWFPYSANLENGPQGIAVDIIKEAFIAENIKVVFNPMNYDRGMTMVKEGLAIGCFDAPRTKEIEESFLWHDAPIFKADSSFYALADYPGQIGQITEVAGKKVGLTQGYGYGNEVDLDTGMLKEYSKSDTIIIKKLLAKRLEFIVLFDKVAQYLISKMNIQGKIKPVGNASHADLYIAFSKVHPEGGKWRDVFNRGLKKIQADGTYQKIMDAWAARLNNY